MVKELGLNFKVLFELSIVHIVSYFALLYFVAGFFLVFLEVCCVYALKIVKGKTKIFFFIYLFYLSIYRYFIKIHSIFSGIYNFIKIDG